MTSQNLHPAKSTGLITKLQALYAQHQQILKYLLIGGMASAIDLALFFILFNLVNTSELMAHSVSVPTAVVFSFVINARHNFKTTNHAWLRFFSFCVVCAIGYAVGYAIIISVQQVFTDAVVGANIGKVLSLPAVFIVQYLLNSKITFRKTGGAVSP
ncbi:GtrA family protein [Hyphomonas sp.]|uniref:GtrA family protein n=1 Tax=Hyphomonas sp. TaxID=87 RepID=UPI001BCB6BBB|nr:GtrA family protein [Hyphomonas sp.]